MCLMGCLLSLAGFGKAGLGWDVGRSWSISGGLSAAAGQEAGVVGGELVTSTQDDGACLYCMYCVSAQ